MEQVLLLVNSSKYVMSYSVVSYLYVSMTELNTSVGKEKAYFSAIAFLLLWRSILIL